MAQDIELSVVAPVFDEQECVTAFVEEICVVLEQTGRAFELVCVDDGSGDNTRALLTALRTRFPVLRPLVLDGHHGQSAAIAAGVAVARGRFITLIDADMQNDPADIPRLLARLERESAIDAVVGVRANRRDDSLRRFSSRFANRCSWWITGDRVSAAGCGLKLFRSEALKRVALFRGAHRFLPTLLRTEGARVVEMAVNHRVRPAGRSKYGRGLSRTFAALWDALGVRWLKERRFGFQVRDL